MQLNSKRKAIHAFVFKEKEHGNLKPLIFHGCLFVLKHLHLDSLTISFANPPLLIPQPIPAKMPHRPAFQRIPLTLTESFETHMDTFPRIRLTVGALAREDSQHIAVFPWRRSLPDLDRTFSMAGNRILLIWHLPKSTPNQRIRLLQGNWGVGSSPGDPQRVYRSG